MIRYVTLAYGDAPGVYRQSLMLLVSLVAHAPEPYELVVATDRPECYVWFGTRVEIEYLDAARLEAWRGPRPFSMRQKLELDPRRRRSPADRPRWSCSTRTSSRGSRSAPFVERLRAGELFMHKHEYVLSQSRRSGNRKLWAARCRRPQDVRVPDDDAMWNSGVLAVAGQPIAALLDEALDAVRRARRRRPAPFRHRAARRRASSSAAPAA